MNVLILNDLHLGCTRKGGTTPESQEALRTYMFSQFAKLLEIARSHEYDIIVAGDLFDDFTVDARDWLQTYEMLRDWLKSGLWLHLVAGNHDDSPKGQKVSSFKLLAEVLGDSGNCKTLNVGEAGLLTDKVYAIAHCANQDLFDLRLREALSSFDGAEYLLVHANYCNKFATGDHSLNLTEDIALSFTEVGVTVLVAHEHQHRVEIPFGTPKDGGSVVVLGNQIGSSCSDWLGGDHKYFWSIE